MTDSTGGSFRLPHRFLLRSRFGQRLLLLFIGCTVIPTGTVALISFRTVAGQLTVQSRERLDALASSVGKGFYERLVLVETDLRKLGPSLASCRAGSGGHPACRDALLYALDALAVVPDHGPPAHLFGDQALTALTASIAAGELPELEPGQSAVLVRQGRPAGGRIWLVHRPTANGTNPAASSHRLVGVVGRDFLWNVVDGLPATVAATLWDADAGMLYSTESDSLRLSPKAAQALGHGGNGAFEWKGDSGRYLATYWSLPPGRRFHLPRWRLVMSESKADVLAPMAAFGRTFPLLLVVCAVGVLALGLIQIRRSLVPLQKLREGTRRIAGRDFDTRVHITSGDEIEELARAFNSMAAQLGRQFSTLRTAAEMDRALLSSVDTARVVDTVLERLPGVCRCPVLSIAVLDRQGVVTTTWVDLERGGRRKTLPAAPLPAADLQHLREHREHVISRGDSGPVPGYLAHLAGPESGLIEAFPLFFGDVPLGILALRHGTEPAAAEELPEVRRLADQVAVALANAGMVEQVRQMAFYDSLTHLPNRMLYKERLGQALVQAQRFRQLVAVCFLDLDNFSTINDTLGHEMGDKLVQDVAARMLTCCREGDSLARFGGVAGAVEVARLGGDEFTFILPDIRGPEDAVAVARRILESFTEPFRLGTQEIFVTASIGIAIYPFDGLDIEDLLKNADVAMYHAKEQGRNTFRMFSAAMNADAVARMRLEQQLRKAVEAGEFTVWYQPIVDLSTGGVAGAEALVRWLHPERGLVSPSEFIPLTEESGLIVPLGLWILKSVCTQAKAWETAGLGPLRMSVNLSTRQLRQEGLVEAVGQILTETGWAPTSLELELTQSVLMDPGGELRATLDALAGTGIGLAIDDFGTGYSSLSYLKLLPVKTLKIDQSFVREVTTDPADAAITQAIITLGGALGMTVVAEGVETEQQAALLQAQGCNMLQGYWLGRPMDAPSFEVYLRASREAQPASKVA